MRVNNKHGFAALYITILVLIVVLAISMSIFILVFNKQQISRDIVSSSQSYYLAEAGAEDALLRLSKNMTWPDPYILTIGNNKATISISAPIGGSRKIISQGNVLNRVRKIEVVYAIVTDNISFHYGAQVGDGGMTMENNSRIKGNVFSNGSVVSSVGVAYIDDTIKVATTGNSIEGLVIGGDAYAYNCKNSSIGGTFYYSGGQQVNCSATKGTLTSPVQPTEPLPIPDEQITKWKDEALAGGVYNGDYSVPGNSTDYLGPRKVNGDLDLANNSTLILNGTLWVTGNITINNGALIKLNSTYGSTSGVIVADGRITVGNGADIQGSGIEGSYTMLLSTNTSLSKDSPAIDVRNNAQGAVFYSSTGLIRLHNNMKIREATGYKLYLDNMAEIEYASGLEDCSFSSGPGGSREVVSWKEVK